MPSSNGGRSPSALATPSPTDITTGNIAANNISATNVTTTNLAATTLSVGATATSGVVTVKSFGAKGDGVTDDTTAIANALSSVVSGGTVAFDSGGTYKVTRSLTLTGSNITLLGNGATILFAPSLPVSNTNNRFMYIAGSYPATTSPIVGSLQLGAKSFTAQNAADAAILNPNDWIMIWEADGPRGDIVFYDQHQVASVSGTTVNLQLQIRTIFPGTHSNGPDVGVRFKKITQLTQNVTVRDLTIHCVNPGIPITTPPNLMVGITIGEGTRGVTIDNLTIVNEYGAGLTAYRSGGYRVTNCHFLSTQVYVEFASSVDCCIENNIFDSYNTSATFPTAGLDFGFAFSTFANNVLTRGGNYAMIVWFGVHDCAIAGNTFGWVRDAGQGRGHGITGTGAYNNNVSNNTLIGGDGTSTYGIFFQDDTVASPNMLSHGNVISSNTINPNGFVYPLATGLFQHSIGDTYFALTNSTALNAPLARFDRTSIDVIDTATNQPLIYFDSTGQRWQVGGDAGGNLIIYDATAGQIGIACYAGGTRARVGRIFQVLDLTTNNPYVALQSTGQEWDINGGTDLNITSSISGGTAFRLYATAKQVQFFGWSLLKNIAGGNVAAPVITPNPIPANSVATFTIPVPNAASGDLVSLGPNATPGASLTWSAYVSAAGVVTVQLANPTTAAVTPLGVTWFAAALRI